METSILLARIVGPVFIIVVIGLLVNLKNYQGVIREFAESPGLRYLGALIALLFGMLIVLFHNVWTVQWSLVITILGWISLIKGAVLIIFPEMMTRLSDRYARSTTALRVHAVIILIIGVFLTVMGFR